MELLVSDGGSLSRHAHSRPARSWALHIQQTAVSITTHQQQVVCGSKSALHWFAWKGGYLVVVTREDCHNYTWPNVMKELEDLIIVPRKGVIVTRSRAYSHMSQDNHALPHGLGTRELGAKPRELLLAVCPVVGHPSTLHTHHALAEIDISSRAVVRVV